MNKAIYLCAAAALALASCSNDETVEMAKGDGISFRTVAGLNTRGAETATADLTTNGVYVTSFKEDGSIMYPETHYTVNAGVWSAGQFWLDQNKLNFYLTYPELTKWQADFELTADNKQITGFKVADEIKDQVDYVAAYVESNKTNTAINAELQHVLSQIEIQAKSSNTAYTYEISGVRIGKIFSTANYTFPTSTADADKFGAFADWSNQYTYSYDIANPVTLKTDGSISSLKVDDLGNAMLIPQSLTAWDGAADGANAGNNQYISIKVKITKVGETTPYYNGWASVGVAGTWEAGNKYIYTLDLTNGAGRVDPEGPGPDQVTEPDQPGDNILGDEIKFDVKVVEWNDVFNGTNNGNLPM